MPDTNDTLLRRLVGGDPKAPTAVLTAAATSDSPSVLVAAGLLAHDPRLLARAEGLAAVTRDRQLVVVAQAYLDGDTDRFDVLVRDHLSEFPDHLLASWIAGQPHHRH